MLVNNAVTRRDIPGVLYHGVTKRHGWTLWFRTNMFHWADLISMGQTKPKKGEGLLCLWMGHSETLGTPWWRNNSAARTLNSLLLAWGCTIYPGNFLSPSSDGEEACDVLRSTVNRLQTQHPHALFLISGDISLQFLLPSTFMHICTFDE